MILIPYPVSEKDLDTFRKQMVYFCRIWLMYFVIIDFVFTSLLLIAYSLSVGVQLTMAELFVGFFPMMFYVLLPATAVSSFVAVVVFFLKFGH